MYFYSIGKKLGPHNVFVPEDIEIEFVPDPISPEEFEELKSYYDAWSDSIPEHVMDLLFHRAMLEDQGNIYFTNKKDLLKFVLNDPKYYLKNIEEVIEALELLNQGKIVGYDVHTGHLIDGFLLFLSNLNEWIDYWSEENKKARLKNI